MKPSPNLIALLIFLLAAAASVAFAWTVSGRVEDEVRARALDAVAMAGARWATVDVDGLEIAVSGTASDGAQKSVVMGAVTAAVAGMAIADRVAIAEQPEIFHPEIAFRIMRGIGHLTVTGAVPGEAARETLSASLLASLPDLAMTDLVRTDARGGDDVLGIADDLAAIAAALLHGTIIVDRDTIIVSGIASGKAEQAEIEDRIAALSGRNWHVTVSLASPPPRIAELVFHAETGPGSRGLIACTAADANEADRIRARAADLFGADATCTATTADETPGWGDAVVAALDALADMPAGEVRLTGQRVRLSGTPPTRKRTLDDATASLRAALPEGFRLMLLTPPPVTEDRASNPVSTTFRIEYDGVSMRMSGDAPSAILAETLGSFARATLRGVAIDATGVDLRPEIPADDWRRATTGLVVAIAELETGWGEITPDRAMIQGTIEHPSQIAAVHKIAARSIGMNRQVHTRLHVAMAELAAAQPLPPTRCAEVLTDITRRQPILFAPGSVNVSEDNKAIIDQLAETLASCSGGRIEIGGHTDNDGAEALNLRLSRERAEAVLTALQESGARLSILTAKGYGEAEPIADNNTDAGRRANRRIAFRAVPEGGDEQ